jgi:hypothetical protein
MKRACADEVRVCCILYRYCGGTSMLRRIHASADAYGRSLSPLRLALAARYVSMVRQTVAYRWPTLAASMPTTTTMRYTSWFSRGFPMVQTNNLNRCGQQEQRLHPASAGTNLQLVPRPPLHLHCASCSWRTSCSNRQHLRRSLRSVRSAACIRQYSRRTA